MHCPRLNLGATSKTFEPKRAMVRRAILSVLNGGYTGGIETEGLGMMAHDMGYECWGMPNLQSLI